MRSIRTHLALFLALSMALSLGAVTALAAPESSMEETVLAEDEQLSVTVTDFDPEGEDGPTFELLLENKSDKGLVFALENAAVNGVMCDPFWTESVPAGQKVYSKLYWYDEDLQTVGVSYVQSVAAQLDVWEDESYDDVYSELVSWELTVGRTDVPPVSPVAFDGFEPVEVLTGDTALTVVACDPAGSYDGGPALVLYMKNDTDKVVWFTAEDVAINGFACDPWWGETVLPGAAAYSAMEWWQDDLADSHIESVETVQFTAVAEDDETYEQYASGSVELDLTAGTGTVSAPAEEPAEEPAGEPAEPEGQVAELMGAVAGGVYTNDYFGVTFAPGEEWTFATREELLAQYDLAAESFEGTEIGEDVKAFMDSDSGFSVMMAQAEGGLQNVNALVESLPGLGKYLSESELLDLVESDLGLEEGGDMTAMGLEGAVLSRDVFTFAGAEHEALRVDYTDTSMGIELPMYIQMVFLMGDDYVMQVTITTAFEDKTADVGAMFTLAE